ncbi:hypothetical protein TYRP_020742 [Tyrophagus putrescentiae]|nr:hypothetical protein TYRP_020742 [Tyrophagus putrescentiae]
MNMDEHQQIMVASKLGSLMQSYIQDQAEFLRANAHKRVDKIFDVITDEMTQKITANLNDYEFVKQLLTEPPNTESRHHPHSFKSHHETPSPSQLSSFFHVDQLKSWSAAAVAASKVPVTAHQQQPSHRAIHSQPNPNVQNNISAHSSALMYAHHMKHQQKYPQPNSISLRSSLQQAEEWCPPAKKAKQTDDSLNAEGRCNSRDGSDSSDSSGTRISVLSDTGSDGGNLHSPSSETHNSHSPSSSNSSPSNFKKEIIASFKANSAVKLTTTKPITTNSIPEANTVSTSASSNINSIPKFVPHSTVSTTATTKTSSCTKNSSNLKINPLLSAASDNSSNTETTAKVNSSLAVINNDNGKSATKSAENSNLTKDSHTETGNANGSSAGSKGCGNLFPLFANTNGDRLKKDKNENGSHFFDSSLNSTDAHHDHSINDEDFVLADHICRKRRLSESVMTGSSSCCDTTSTLKREKYYKGAFILCDVPTCAKPFDNPTSLNQHLEKVHRIYPVFCVICSATFPTGLLLKDHIDEVHGHQLKFICNLCYSAYPSYRSLSTHFKRQHFKRNYKCPVRECKFTSDQCITVMEHHAKVHEQLKDKPDVASTVTATPSTSTTAAAKSAPVSK